MKYSVVILNGGDYCNIDAPLTVEANCLNSLESEILSSFELTGSQIQMTYCGKILSRQSRLPRDGATIYISTKTKIESSFFKQGEAKFNESNSAVLKVSLDSNSYDISEY
jgi:hypothetical protein